MVLLADAAVWTLIGTVLVPINGLLFLAARRERERNLALLKASLRLKVRR